MRGVTPRPVVGVTGPDRGGGSAWLFTWLALWRVGACAVRITPARPYPPARLDGLVIGGGADVTEPLVPVDPSASPPRERVRWPRRLLDLLLAPFVLLVRYVAAAQRHGEDRARDALEVGLLEHARRFDLPVLGICRGVQLMNLVDGGTLERDIDDLYEERPQLYTVLPRREVEVSRNSRLHTIVGRESLLVNSMHFHAIKEPGPGFWVTAREPRGVPQAIEHRSRTFWLGVQWHPEYLPQQPPHQLIFRALVDSARQGVRERHGAQRSLARAEGSTATPRPAPRASAGLRDSAPGP
jgi:putative glutamine amidotransferase